MELKTVQVNDELTIGRPCIDAANIGYNIEWSQELRVPDSLDQYVARRDADPHAAHCARRLRQSVRRCRSMAGTVGETIYDMSIGYDLAGIQTPEGRQLHPRHDRRHAKRRPTSRPDSAPAQRRCATSTTRRNLSRSITLSTFHGCPADEIERICEFLLTELGVHTIVKMNPPMLGNDRLEHLLYDVMGYTRPHA